MRATLTRKHLPKVGQETPTGLGVLLYGALSFSLNRALLLRLRCTPVNETAPRHKFLLQGRTGCAGTSGSL